jgi:hypothetical protein
MLQFMRVLYINWQQFDPERSKTARFAKNEPKLPGVKAVP